MKNLFHLIKTGILALLPFVLACKVSVTTGGAVHLETPPLGTIFTSLPAMASTAFAWFELVVRLVPTSRNYSFIDFAFRLLKSLVPNKAAADADPKATELSFSGGQLIDIHQ